MDATVKTTQIIKPTHVTLTMTWDEANLLFSFLGKIDLNTINEAMGIGKHYIKFGSLITSCSCGDVWPCPANDTYRDTNEAVYQMFLALDTSLRKHKK